MTSGPGARSWPRGAAPSAWRSIAIIIGSALTAALVIQVPIVERLSNLLDDMPVRLTTRSADLSGVLLFDLAARELASEANQSGLGPYKRATFANVSNYLAKHGARATVFQLLFPETEPDDAELARALGPSAVLAAAAVPFSPRATTGNDRRDLSGLAIATGGPERGLPPHYAWPNLSLPTSALMTPARPRVGVVNFETDRDGTMRRYPLFHGSGGLVLPSMPLAALAATDRITDPVEHSGSTARLGPYQWPITDRGEVMLRMPPNVPQVPTYSFHRLALAAMGARPDPVLPDLVRGKTVFIGNSDPSAGDTVETAVGRLSGLALSAIGYTQLRNRAVLTPSTWWGDALLLLAALIPALMLLSRKRLPPTPALVASFVFAAAIPTLAGFALGTVGMLAHWSYAALAGLAGVAYAGAYLAARDSEVRRRRKYEKLALNDANRMKTEFLNHLTHELRTPLTAIMGFNKINQHTDELGKDQRISNSSVIGRNCEHLLALINNNLDLAKIEAGQLSIVRASEDPEQIFRDVVATMRALATDKQIELKYTKLTPLPETLLLDAFRLRQVLINLMGNAVKFTQKGVVELAVGWHVAALEIEVRDTGAGIAPESMDRIWQPFKQADLTIGRRFGGTGLGLAISRKLVELMGGEITVESQVGLGTTFRVRVPSESIAKRAAPESVPGSLGRVEKLSGRVLLADDNEDVRNLFVLLLRGLGVQVRTAENGLVAVETAMAEEPDVILMDMEMPVMNGYEAVHVLRTRGYTKTILGLTAHQEGMEVSRAILSGCDAVLTKPISGDALKQALAPLLDRRRTDRPTIEPSVPPRAAAG